MRSAAVGSSDPGQVAREQVTVELVDDSGQPSGTASVAVAHRRPGLRHRAFSVLLLSPDRQRLLLQQRAATKIRFPLRWANSCCGHPAPGQSPAAAAARRLVEELRLDVAAADLTEIGVHQYQADDPDSGLAEHEYDHVLLGWLSPDHPLHPDPAEVAELRWVAPAQLAALLDSDQGTPWLAGVTAPLATAVGAHWAR